MPELKKNPVKYYYMMSVPRKAGIYKTTWWCGTYEQETEYSIQFLI